MLSWRMSTALAESATASGTVSTFVSCAICFNTAYDLTDVEGGDGSLRE